MGIDSRYVTIYFCARKNGRFLRAVFTRESGSKLNLVLSGKIKFQGCGKYRKDLKILVINIW